MQHADLHMLLWHLLLAHLSLCLGITISLDDLFACLSVEYGATIKTKVHNNCASYIHKEIISLLMVKQEPGAVPYNTRSDSIPSVTLWCQNVQPTYFHQFHRASCIYTQIHLKGLLFLNSLPLCSNFMKLK